MSDNKRVTREIRQIVAMQECVDGNESVGSMWVETKTFLPQQTLAEVIEWSDRLRVRGGKLIIREESDR